MNLKESMETSKDRNLVSWGKILHKILKKHWREAGKQVLEMSMDITLGL